MEAFFVNLLSSHPHQDFDIDTNKILFSLFNYFNLSLFFAFLVVSS